VEPDEETTPQDDALRKLEMAEKVLSLAYALMSIVLLLWMLIPEHKKRLMAMQVIKTLERNAWQTAFRAGHQAMGLELRGRATSYDLPYRLSLLGEKAGRAYEKLRYTA
jgi:hypothetical protein